jgi:hypothetical protein
MSKAWRKFTVCDPHKDLHGDMWIQEDQIVALATNSSRQTLVILRNQSTVAIEENKRSLANSLDWEYLVFQSGTMSLVGTIYVRESSIIAIGQGTPNLIFIEPYGIIGVIGPFDSLLDYLTKED